jgi:ketosteroid isomerase-like protein
MQPCAELKNLVLQNYEKEASGKIFEVVSSSYSRQEGVTLLGSDPNEWFEGYEAIFHFYEPAFSSKLEVKVEELKAFCEGNVGWTIDRVKVKLPSGVELPMRHTRIFQKEHDAWKIVHNHISIAVPNESIGE